MNYNIFNFVIQIKNASLAKRRSINVPYAKISEEIGKVLVKNGFLQDIKKEAKENRQILTAHIKYENREPAVSGVLIVSKPSLKVYGKRTNILKEERRGMGVCILSTNKGIMTVGEAYKQGLGGEILFKIW